ncbi:4-hydroxy-tetrahydrodipicolinate synthase [Edaphobacter modestus]|uniref:4-hydroxy-tetrahydrodipicolinate synthase n=1 Tax=Edaphobacter modestus TaxID=388466 RepID=A0A4Q7YZ76_9BACT|nr:4-hydroxy-tetrahydrodipicolinate synthase [Edaphobacter modestus]RZU42591.1 4-hydroxy-tetrahydrodipicolinate synthase [Edaphobacter modestus]
MELMGCGTALVTPFRGDSSVDEAGLRALVEWQIESGISFLVPCGTTGEAATLSEQEWLRVVEVVVETAAGRVPVFGGCTNNSTHEAVAKAKKLAQVSGLSGVLTANPYYNKPGQEGQYQHFRAIAEAVDLPVLLYNIPGRTGVNLEPATVLRLAELPNVIGIKESSGNISQITELLTTAPQGFKVFAGDDSVALPLIALGGAGLVSVASNVIPAEMSAMVRSALAGDWEKARNINRRYFRLMLAHFWEPSPAPVKAVLRMIGRGEDVLRLPMVPVSDAGRKRLEALVEELGLLHPVAAQGDSRRVS